MKLTLFQKVLVWLAASSCLAIALRWAYIVFFTTYREHLHLQLGVIALFSTVFAVALFLLNTWAVLLSIALSVLLGIATVWLQVSGEFVNPFLVFVALACGLYVVALFPAIAALTSHSRRDARKAGAP